MPLDLIVVRHALAEDREEFKKSGLDDKYRPLTPKGRRDMKKSAKALKAVVGRVDMLLTSPFRRARETAEILHLSFRSARLIEVNELKPMISSLKTLRALQKLGRVSSVIIVGHEPHLGKFLSFILTGSSRNIFDIKKGCFCRVEFAGRVEKKLAKLTCLIQPSQVKKIRKS